MNKARKLLAKIFMWFALVNILIVARLLGTSGEAVVRATFEVLTRKSKENGGDDETRA